MAYQSVNPYNGKVLKTFEELTDEQLETALETAATCFETWRHTTFAERAAVVAKAAAIMRAARGRVRAPGDARDGQAHRPGAWRSRAQRGHPRLLCQERRALPGAQHLKPSSGEAEVESSPLGVLFGIQPWNFPYYQLARFAAPNLMAGNVVMVKHAGCVPQCAIAFEKLWLEAGAPAGAYTNLLISHDQVNRVIDDPRIKGVALTGSVEAGKSVAGTSGTKPQEVDDGAGRQRRLHRARGCRSGQDGQVGGLGQDEQHGPVLRRGEAIHRRRRIGRPISRQVPDGAGGAQAGDPMDEATTLGPLSTEAALVQLLDQVKRAVANGATLVMGGKRIDRPGSFMQPTILTNIKPGNPAFREEFFGPVALFFRVKNEDEAVALANDSDFGLGGSVFTRDIARGKRVASRVDTGMMFVNHPTWTTADLPFGGIKNSGYGRELSSMGIQEFVNKKLVRVASIDAPA